MLNEHFTASIQSVNDSHSALHCNESKNRNRSDELQSEYEAWLARGNKVTELPIGHTHFKDGILPASRENAKANKKSEQDRKKELEQKNAEIKAYKEALKKQAALASTAKREEQRKLKEKLKREKEKKAKEVRVKELKLVTFTHTDEYWRKQMMKCLRESALSRGDEVFKAKCLNHGWTDYRLYGQSMKCIACSSDAEKKKREKKEHSPLFLLNQEKSRKRKEAIAQGKKEFTSTCKHHGEVVYRLRSGNRSVCSVCLYETNKTKLKNRLTDCKTKNPYFYELKAAREEAKEKGVLTFEHPCNKCDGTTHKIKEDGTSFCVKCSNERERLRRNKARLDFNKSEKEKALSEGQARFIGKCDRHGKSEFKIYKNHGAVFYKCVECSNAASKVMNSRDKDDCLADPKNTFIREWFEKNKCVKKKDLFTRLGWSKSSFNHYTSGRAICPDDKYEAFVELVKKLESSNEEN